MNGRAYDYNLGRFLSVDPFIQEPGNSQSMNPYSYIMNNPLAGTDPSGYVSVGNLGVTEEHCGFMCMTGMDKFTWAGDNGKRGQSKQELDREIAALGGQDNLEAYDWYQNHKRRVTVTPVSGGTNVDERIQTVGSGSETTSVEGDGVQSAGDLFCAANCYKSEDDAHIAASERYLAASLEANREATWRVYELDDGSFSFTYAHVGEEEARQARLPSKNKKLSFISAGHTHWDSNTAFSPQDWRLITQEKKKGLGIKLYVATKDGKVQYSTPKHSRKKGIEMGLKFLPPTSDYNGTYLEGVQINTTWE